jgi:hypothetical protein
LAIWSFSSFTGACGIEGSSPSITHGPSVGDRGVGGLAYSCSGHIKRQPYRADVAYWISFVADPSLLGISAAPAKQDHLQV